MAFNKIRGEQIKDRVIKDQHIAGKLSEAVLNINFANHASEIFEQKIVVDYVQKSDVTVASDGTAYSIVLPARASQGAHDKGIVLNSYEVKMRLKSTGEPLIHGTDSVYGKLTDVTENSGNFIYTLSFFADVNGTETAVTVPGGTTLDLLYPQRFTFDDIDETFAANERFVDASADVSAHLNFKQLQKDIFGPGYTYNNMGDKSNPFGNNNTLVQQMTQETSGVISGEKANNIIDEVVEGRGSYDKLTERFENIEQIIGESGAIDVRLDALEDELHTARGSKLTLNSRLNTMDQTIADLDSTHRTDLASKETGKGASMVGVKDGSDVATGLNLTTETKTVQGALDSMYNRLVTDIGNEQTARANDFTNHRSELASTTLNQGASLIGLHDASNHYASTTVEAALKELYEKLVNDVSAEATARTNADTALDEKFTPFKQEVETARGVAASLDNRLDVSLNDDGTFKDYTQIHNHIKKHKVLAIETATVDFMFTASNQFNTPKTSDTYDVHLNGIKQIEGPHYSVTVSGNTVQVSFNGTLLPSDIVELTSTIYAIPQQGSIA